MVSSWDRREILVVAVHYCLYPTAWLGTAFSRGRIHHYIIPPYCMPHLPLLQIEAPCQISGAMVQISKQEKCKILPKKVQL